MPLLWPVDDRLEPIELEGSLALDLTVDPPRRTASITRKSVLITSSDGGKSWNLLCGPGCDVLVNGIPLDLGVRLLRDRDELRLAGGGHWFFSAETLASIEPFEGGREQAFCPRCKDGVDDGCPSVRCPGCGLVHHQTEELPCWTYEVGCASCAHPTGLETGYQWTPELL